MFPLGVPGVTNIGVAHEQLKDETPSLGGGPYLSFWHCPADICYVIVRQCRARWGLLVARSNGMIKQEAVRWSDQVICRLAAPCCAFAWQ